MFVLFYSGVFGGNDRRAGLACGHTLAVNFVRYVTVVPNISHSVSAVINNVSRQLAHGTTTRFSFFLTIPAVFNTAYLRICGLVDRNNNSLLARNGGLMALLLNSIMTFVITVLTVGFFVGCIAGCNFTTFN